MESRVFNRQPGQRRRSVWVLMFESVPLKHTLEYVHEDSTAISDETEEKKPDADDQSLADNEAKSTEREAYTTFDDLDIKSAFFEQYLIQDTRIGVTTTDVLGGEATVRSFQQLLTQHGCLMASIVLGEAGRSADPDTDPPLLKGMELGANTVHISLKSPSESGESLSELMVDDSRFRDADLLWIDVRNGGSKQDSAWSALIAGEITKLYQRFSDNPAEQPVLIVSSLRGSTRAVAPPFIGGCEESLIHVPLWIDDGSGHVRRLQKLAGSFDLLPTLADYLIGDPSEDHSQITTNAAASSNTEAESKNTATLAIGPQSLRPILRDFRCEGDRLLRLVGDGWSALRSQQYLLVSAEMQDKDSDVRDSGLDRRRLYLKPDDVWNVHDSIVTYEAVADEMDAAWQQTHA